MVVEAKYNDMGPICHRQRPPRTEHRSSVKTRHWLWMYLGDLAISWWLLCFLVAGYRSGHSAGCFLSEPMEDDSGPKIDKEVAASAGLMV